MKCAIYVLLTYRQQLSKELGTYASPYECLRGITHVTLTLTVEVFTVSGYTPLFVK